MSAARTRTALRSDSSTPVRIARIALTTWKDREGDDAWKDRVIAHLTARRTSEDLEAIKRDKAHVRVRPEDTAGSATVIPLPAAFDDAVQRGAGDHWRAVECQRSTAMSLPRASLVVVDSLCVQRRDRPAGIDPSG